MDDLFQTVKERFLAWKRQNEKEGIVSAVSRNQQERSQLAKVLKHPGMSFDPFKPIGQKNPLQKLPYDALGEISSFLGGRKRTLKRC